jgi:hypothetical protein
MASPPPLDSNAWSPLPPGASDQNPSAWQDSGAESQMASSAFLPMIYQESSTNDGQQSTFALQLIHENAVQHLLPEISAVPESVYVPPLYTKPRPLIPRYRIVSGTLSVLIVVLLLCGGIGYVAQSTGALKQVMRAFTNEPPPPVKTASAQRLPDPPNKIDTGPAVGIIPSGTTTLHIDEHNVALQTDKVFIVNQPFYVTYTVQPPEGQDGKVTVKWYMNSQLYLPVTSKDVIKGGTTQNGSLQMQYIEPAQGSVEIYWNDQLAQRFYFVVQPAE